MSNRVDPVFEYVDAPKRIDFTKLAKEEEHVDNWFDSIRATGDSEFNQVYKLQGNGKGFYAPGMDESDESGFSSSENESFNSTSRTEQPFNHTKSSFTVKSWEPVLTVPRSPKFATESRIRSNVRPEQPKSRPAHTFRLGDLTVPETPKFATEHRLKRKILQSTEDMQMNAIKQEIDTENKRRKFFQDKLRTKLATQIYAPERTARGVTQPKEFHFQTDQRLRHDHDHDHSGSDCDHDHSHEKSLKYTGGMTVPHPFSFQTDGRLKETFTAEEPFVSAVEKAQNFLRRDKKSYLTRHQENSKKTQFPYDPTNWKLTVPQEFSFETDVRISNKPKENYKSIAEREEEEMRNIQPFKAKPVDKKVLAGTQISIKMERPASTKPVPFHFTTDDRIKEPKYEEMTFTTKNNSFRSSREFSKPFNRELTVPESPALNTKSRALNKPQVPKQEETFIFKARPVPVSAPFVPKSLDVTLTEPEPFPLKTDRRGTVAQQRLKQQIEREKEEEERNRQFIARAMPMMDESFNQVIESSTRMQAPFKELTQPKPFQLKAEERGQNYEQTWKVKVDEEFRKEAENRQFKARKFVQKPVYEPVKSIRALTEINDFTMNSDSRAQKRQEWENEQSAKQRAAEEMKRKYDVILNEKKQKELEEYRKSLVFKAGPVTRGKPVSLKASNMPLTEPQSPMLRTKRRVGMRDL